ncbi:MAG TPA: hypothetical protein VFQ96_02300 [Microbacteriaceae bacterium]|nr:hypothetical protein [Microbacteriaceae bacterium]
MTPQPTGRLVRREDGVYVVLDRVFLASRDDVWGSLTRPYRLAGWMGECTGERETRAYRIRKRIPGMAWEDLAILECDSPSFFRGVITSDDGEERRHVYWKLARHDSYTTLTVGQRQEGRTLDPITGVRTEYLLDCLVAARAKRPLPTWEVYEAALLPFYERVVQQGAPLGTPTH